MADTTYKEEYDTLASIFNTGWEDEADVQYENLPYTPSTGTKWVRFNVISGEASQASIGAPGGNYYRYPGTVQVQCFAPVNMGVSVAKELADKALGIFHNKIQSGYIFRPGYAATMQNSTADGWYQVSAIIPYWRESIK